MQTNENHPNRKRIRNFFREKGYYIVLALCVCAVGVSGWLFVSNAVAEKKALRQETLSIVDCIREGRYAFEDEVIGIVSPSYF